MTTEREEIIKLKRELQELKIEVEVTKFHNKLQDGFMCFLAVFVSIALIVIDMLNN